MAHMLSVHLMSSNEIALALAQRLRARRLAQKWTQVGLAQRSGVSLGTLKRFESTGQISLASLLQLAQALDALAGIEALFQPPAYQTLDDVLQVDEPKRKRGSRS